jgi:hypothetical protein
LAAVQVDEAAEIVAAAEPLLPPHAPQEAAESQTAAAQVAPVAQASAIDADTQAARLEALETDVRMLRQMVAKQAMLLAKLYRAGAAAAKAITEDSAES